MYIRNIMYGNFKGKIKILKKHKKTQRQNEIETAAYELLDEFGYDGISMLKIAKRAKASNETLYRWYGDKLGLFKSLVENNASGLKEFLLTELEEDIESVNILQNFGPKLLGLLLGPRAIALNRAAASDPSGILGKSLAKSGRETIMPLVTALFERICDEKDLAGRPAKLAELYIRLLVGDLQIRRATGALEGIADAEINQRAMEAKDIIMRNLLAKTEDES